MSDPSLTPPGASFGRDQPPEGFDDDPSFDEEPDLREDLRELIDDARALLEAEMKFHRLRFHYGLRETRRSIYIATLGLGFLIAATITLAVGALIALGPIIGPWWAMVVVTGGSLALAAGFLAIARRKFSRLRELFRFTSDEQKEEA